MIVGTLSYYLHSRTQGQIPATKSSELKLSQDFFRKIQELSFEPPNDSVTRGAFHGGNSNGCHKEICCCEAREEVRHHEVGHPKVHSQEAGSVRVNSVEWLVIRTKASTYGIQTWPQHYAR